MDLEPHVSVLILNYNGRNWLERFLPSALATKYSNFSVIVADNASTDDSCAWLETTYPAVRLIKLAKNYGFATGNNLAAAQIDSPYIVFLNSDVEVDSAWLAPLVKRMEAMPKLAAIQPKIRSFYEKENFEYAGAAGGFIDELGYPLCRGRMVNICERDNGQYDDFRTIFWAGGACILVRKSVIAEIGLFEGYFFAHQEEIDFCWRAQLAGYQIAVEPLSLVFHVGGGTLAQQSPRKSFLNFRNNLMMIARLYPAPQVFFLLFFRLCLDGLAGFVSLIKLNYQQTLAILQAHFAFYGQFSAIFRFRKQFRYPRRPLRELTGVYKGWFLIHFFLLNTKVFSKLPPKRLKN
ncbi:MAG: glycosyltransferase family 2 protein [Bacteroidia bacterium]|nr:glycosyltransferase family 2 protein [Bacteroidia bacterium]